MPVTPVYSQPLIGENASRAPKNVRELHQIAHEITQVDKCMSERLSGKINGLDWIGAKMKAIDDINPIPIRWLAANAWKFHFPNCDILKAAIPHDEDFWPGRICGIYFIIEQNTITYVGLSNHIARRLSQHWDSGMKIERFAWFEAPEYFLREIEAYYIQRVNPRRNTDKPGLRTFTEMVSGLC